MRKVLIVSYYWPPNGGIGAIRLVKFAKFLPEFGWSPVVLTVPETVRDIYPDRSLEDELPRPVTVYRSGILPLFSEMFGRPKMVPGTGRPAARPRWLNFLSRLVYLPDNKIRWLAHAVRLGRAVIRREKTGIIFTSAPPNSVHLIGLFLKKSTGQPWVADFRDRWTRNIFYAPVSPLHRRIEQYLEKLVVTKADRVIVTTEPIRQEFIKIYPGLPADKFVTITNGYDPDDFTAISPTRENRADGKFTIVFTGSLYRGFTAGAFYQALAEWFREQPEMADQVRVILVGYFEPAEQERIESAGLSRWIELIGWQPHRLSLSYLQRADLNLLILPAGPAGEHVFTGKIFEYLGIGRPILALAPPGIAADLIRRSGAGRVVDPGSAAAVKQALEKLYADWRRGELKVTVDRALLKNYERRELTRRLAGVFDRERLHTPPFKAGSVELLGLAEDSSGEEFGARLEAGRPSASPGLS